MPLPETLTQHYDRSGVRSLVADRVEQPPERGRSAQFTEPVGGDKLHLELFLFAFHCQAGVVQSQHGREPLAIVAKERHFGIRQDECVRLGRSAMKAQQRGRLADIQRAQHHEVEKAECGDVDTGADGEHQNRHQREAGRFPQQAGGIAQVLQATVDPGPAPGVAGFLAQVERVAERHAALADGHLAVKLQVGSQLGIEAAAVQQISQAAQKLSHRRSPLSGAQHGLNGFVHAIVRGQLGFQLLAAGGRKPVEADFAIRLGDSPLGGNPSLEKDFL